MNKDFVLRDFSHFISDKEPFEIYLLPEDTTNWSGELSWDIWGLDNLRTISFFLSSFMYETIVETFFENGEGTIINSLLIMPNGSILEITDVQFDFEGGNNLFVYPDDKSVYRITTKMYSSSKQDEITTTDDPTTTEKVEKTIEDGLLDIEFNEDEIAEDTFDTLDEYFGSLDDTKEEQDTEGKKISNSDSIFGSLG
jgi:hypothetical protein